MARPLTLACRTLALVLSALLFGVPATGEAQDPVTTEAVQSIVFVFDGSGARISGERVRRAVATALHQNVVRITDTAASSAAATLTVAFESPDRWVLDIVRGETHVARQVRLRTPTVGSLARVVVALVRDTEAPPVRPRTTSVRRDDEWIATIGDEIIDPFGNLPVTAYRGRGVVDELVDPFGNGATTIASSRRRDGVIDPWAR